MKRSLRTLTGIVALLAAGTASAKDLPNYNAYYDEKPVTPVLLSSARALASGVATSMDEQRGVPSFLWASISPSSFQAPQIAVASPAQAARMHLKQYASVYGASDKALETAVVTEVHDLGRGGIIVALNQVVDGVELYRNEIKVLMHRNHELVAISGSPNPSAVAGLAKNGVNKWKLAPEKALTNALNDLYETKLSPSSVLDTKTVKANYQYYDLLPTPEVKAQDLVFSEPARVKKVYFPLPDRLVPAYFVEVLVGNNTTTEADAYSYVIAADDGRVLYRVNLTHSAAFTYRVWADDAASGGRPHDGPINDLTPHPTGNPDGTAFTYTMPTLVTMDGFNKNPNNTFDPWLLAGDTQTQGNNVDAYTDIATPDGFTAGKDFRADVTGANTFDRIYNTAQDPTANQNQGKAALAMIFYETNWLHDWYYDSGFNEAAGNAQQNNFGRGGLGGDPLHAEGQDSAATQKNNANMSAMSDGTSPRMQMYVWDGKTPGVRADGTIDNGVVAHEWGHYIHLRNVRGCGNQQCGAESEGWGDFTALAMIARQADKLDGAFAVAIYAVQGIFPMNGAYFGIRRYPYSVDMTKNASTFKHISSGMALPNVPKNPDVNGSNAEVHNAGEIWSAMLWEAYVALLKNSQGANAPYTFDQARRRMSDYIVAGMKMAPQDPTFTEQRDGILAAAAAADLKDFLILAGAFAKRGAGTCAVSPARQSTMLGGVVEDYGLKPEVRILSVVADDSILSCDTDGILDAQEKGKVAITIKNTGTAPLIKTTATVSSGTPGVSFPNGATATFGNVAPFATATSFVEINLSSAVVGMQNLALNVAVNDPDACTMAQNNATTTRINYDDVPNSTATDDVESDKPLFTPVGLSGPPADAVWARKQPAPPNTVWTGVDYGSNSDTALESPTLNVAAGQAFILSFKHRHTFEQGMGINWDGAVIEVTTDNGMNWSDITKYGPAAYGGVIGDNPNQAHNPLNGRQGYIGTSAGWPNLSTVTINMGNTLAGQNVKVRFRLGSDDASGEYGWDLDDIAFQGTTNKPFSTIGPNAASCANLPTANAGPDQVVYGGDLVTLDGSKSSDPLMLPLNYAWSELSGPMISLMGANMVKPTFIAPTVPMDTPMTFQLVVVNASKGSASAVANVLVKPGSSPSSGSGSNGSGMGGSNGAGGAGGGFDVGNEGGCNCTTVGTSSSTTLSPLVAFALLALRRRRRAARV